MDHQPHSTALLVMDVQRGLVERLPEGGSLLDRLRQAIGAAREQGMKVVFVRIGFRSGFPEISPRNRSFAALTAQPDRALGEDDEDTQIHAALEPRPEEPVVLKKRVSAFTGSDLEVVLRSSGTTRLVLTGIATSGVVLSTLREAADRDYEVTVLSDGCADPDDEVHRILLDKIFPRQAEVTTVGEWVGRRGSTPR